MSHAPVHITRLLGSAALLAALVVLSTAFSSLTVRYGPAVPVGEGTARTYLVIADDGSPVELGVALDEAALRNLPDLMGVPADEAIIEFELGLPEGAPPPYRHVTLDWNPHGHVPAGIFDHPHFDVHFYLIDAAERVAIDPADPAFTARADRAPDAAFIPAGYVNPGGTTVPRMGTHWIDPASPEFNGETFTRSFLYGTWDGRLIFLEPMITEAYLASKPDVTVPLAGAERYEQSGWYPTSYRVRFDAETGEHRVALSGFRRVD